MRLTLRTLLAWLDDTLSPAEVREMGQQVSESQYAQDLVERIQRVTRQRRLTVPDAEGPDGADPNIIAAYLDNELAAGLVAEYERRCLASDVHLAEVASVHQILSLIGQKAKVPGPAKWRMYRLIKGPEVGPRPAASKMPEVSEPAVPEWSRDDLALPSFWEKNGPTMAIAGLVVVLAFSAWKVIGPTRDAGGNRIEEIASNVPAVPPPQNQPPAPQPPPGPEPAAMTPEMPPEEVPDTAKPPEPAQPAPRPEPPANAFAVFEPGGGILLRGRPGGEDWERLEPNAAIKSGDLLTNLHPFRNAVRVGGMLVELDGATRLRILAGNEGTPIRFELEHGRFVIREADAPVEIMVTTLDIPPKRFEPLVFQPIRVRANLLPVAVEKMRHASADLASVLRVMAAGGKLGVTAAGAEVPYDAPAAVDATYSFAANLPPESWPTVPPKLAELKDPALPDWMTYALPEPVDVQRSENFARELIKPGRGIAESLAEVANSSAQLDLRALALAGLGETGDLDSVIAALMSAGKRTDRKAAIQVLREQLIRGPWDADRIEKKLRDIGDKNAEWPTLVMKLLRQIPPPEAQWDRQINDLVGLLSSDDVELRELALDNLMAFAGRDEMGYDPDSPSTGKGLNDWQTAARTKALKPVKPDISGN